jgi:acetyl/propionyl-CoA carboxylase alpha subunit
MEIKYNNNKYNISTDIQGDMVLLTIDNEKSSFQIKEISPNIVSFFIENGYKNVYTAEDENNIYVALEGNNFVFEKIKEEEKSFKGGLGGDNSDRIEIKPPMPGSIVKVLVEKGQKVSEGDALIIVEAMKMETSLYTSIDGIITEINVSAGEQVDSNKIMLIVEKEIEIK